MHELAVMFLAEQPHLLELLLRKVAQVALDGPLSRVDANVRLANPIEVRPDLLYERPDGSSAAVEVQNKIDEHKRRRWTVMMSALQQSTGKMGDLIVLTASRRVAKWARQACHVRGPLGTTLTLTPIVILLTDEVIEELLDPAHPELSFFAAWAMHDRHGPRAQSIVQRAVTNTARLPPELQATQRRAIFAVLSEPMLAFMKETSMDPNKIVETPRSREVRELYEAYLDRSVDQMDPAVRARVEAVGEAKGEAKGRAVGEAEGEAKGEADALLTVLEARGFEVSEADRARVTTCRAIETLRRWTRQAVTAESVEAALS